MCDSELKKMLTSTEMDAEPDPAHVQALRKRVLHIAGRAGRRTHLHRNALVVMLVVIGVSGVGMAATEKGRNFIRSILTPVQPLQSAVWEAPNGDTWSQMSTGRDEPLSPEEEEAVAQQFAENYASKLAGDGRLVGLIESPGFTGVSQTVYLIEYTRSTGEKDVVGSSRPTGEQAENMRIDEIMQLRDSGQGTIITEEPFPIGTGKYMIRLTLSDGSNVDLDTFFPPSTLEEREQIFAEMRELKAGLRFKVLDAHFDAANPVAGVWGNLQYQLQDGRMVGSTEQLPPEVISQDGTQVVMPDLDAPIPVQGTVAEPD